MGRIRYAACLAAVLAGGITVAGCGGDQSAGSSSPTSSAASPSVSATKPPASPSVSPSASPSYSVPAAARVQSEAGAIAFVKFFWSEVNRSWMEPSSNVLPVLSDPHCAACSGLQERAEALVADRQRYDAAPATVRSLTQLEGAPPGQMFFTMALHQNAARTIDSNGKTVDTAIAKDSTRRIAVIWKAERWLLYAMA